MNAFNELSDAEAERLALLAEECGEVIHAIGKILRHGYWSVNPDEDDGPDNRSELATELGHVRAAQVLMEKQLDIDPSAVTEAFINKQESVKKYLHHQL